MSAIENLIQIKKQCKNDDIVRIMDEVTDYEKLSRSPVFRDLRTSKPAQKKLPLLSSAYQGDLYALSLLTLAGNIIAHLTDQVPRVLQIPLEELSERDQKRMNLMTGSLIPVSYHGLLEYDNEAMTDRVVAVYDAPRLNGSTALLIVVRDQDTYQIYQGYYYPKDGTRVQDRARNELKPFVFQKDHVTVSFLTYSLLGNNRYPFGTVIGPDGCHYQLSMGYDRLYLEAPSTDRERCEIELNMSQRNQLNLVKMDPMQFGEELVGWLALYLVPAVVTAPDRTVTVDGYQLQYGNEWTPIGRMEQAGQRAEIYFRSRYVDHPKLEYLDEETGRSRYVLLSEEGLTRLEGLRNDAQAFVRELMEQELWKERIDDAKIGTDTPGGPSGDQTDPGDGPAETAEEV